MRRYSAIFVLTVLTLTCAGRLFTGLAKRGLKSPSSPSIHFDPRTLDFGTVWESPEFRWDVAVVNDSGTPVELIDPSTSCTCTSILPNRLLVPPWGRERLHLSLDLMGAREENEPGVRPFQTRVRLRTRQSGAVVTATVQGQVRPLPVSRIPRVLTIPDFVTGTAPSQEIVDLTVTEQVSALAVQADSAGLATATIEPLAGSKRVWRLQVVPAETLTPGAYQSQLLLTITVKEGEAPLPLRIPVEGQVLPDLFAAPSQLLFGAVPASAPRKTHVALGRRNGAQLAVEDVRVASGSCAIEWSVPDADDPGGVQLSFRGAGTGDQEGLLEFIVTDNQSVRESLRIPVRWFGD